VLKQSIKFSAISNGAFDITVWPLIHLWKTAAKNGVFPSEESLASVREFIGADKIELLPEHQLRLKTKQTKLDLGGIAAGYAVDEVVRIFRENGIDNFFIDLGGDIFAGGVNCEGKKWRVGISDPRDRSKIFEIVHLSNMAITTSGNYEKFYQLGEKRLSHIVNPTTGYPQDEMVAATLIAPTTIEADALATAVMVMGKAPGLRMVEKMGGNYAAMVLVPDDSNRLLKSSTQEYPNFLLSD
jgi:thiamine biosynthesis lipoprotein